MEQLQDVQPSYGHLKWQSQANNLEMSIFVLSLNVHFIYILFKLPIQYSVKIGYWYYIILCAHAM